MNKNPIKMQKTAPVRAIEIAVPPVLISLIKKQYNRLSLLEANTSAPDNDGRRPTLTRFHFQLAAQEVYFSFKLTGSSFKDFKSFNLLMSIIAGEFCFVK